MNENLPSPSSDEISLKELIQKIGEWYRYLKTQWWKIAIAGFIGGVIGFIYTWMQPITYTAKTTFVVEDAKSSGGGLGSLASLAGQFGVDVGGGGVSSGGIISGDNILFYLKSPGLCRETLLSSWDTVSNLSFADIYLKMKADQLTGNDKTQLSMINYHTNKQVNSNSRIEDSVLKKITKEVIKSSLSVSRIDKKASFVEIKVTSNSEVWAKRLCEKLLETAIKKYVNLKTERQQKTVFKLQERLDSISRVLSIRTLAAATLQTAGATMDVNPLYRTDATIKSELTSRDKALLTSVYVEVSKNLEVAKFTLSQETPVIQVIDSSNFPLDVNKSSKLQASLLWAIIFSWIFIFYISVKKFFSTLWE